MPESPRKEAEEGAPSGKARRVSDRLLCRSELCGRLLGAHVSIVGGIERAVDRAAHCGFSAAQIFLKNCRQWTAPALGAEEALAFRRAASASGIFFFAHAGYLLNLAASSDALAERSSEALRDEVRRAARLGLPFLVLHPGAAAPGEDPDAALARLVRRLRALFPKEGSPAGVRIALETMAGQGNQLGWRLEQIRRILDDLDDPGRFGVCLDTAHLWAAGYPLATSAGYRAFVAMLKAQRLVDRIWAIHLNDSATPFGSRRDRHEHLGKGSLGLAGFGPLLRDPRWFRIPMVLETPKEEGVEADCRNLHAILPFLSRIRPEPQRESADEASEAEKSIGVPPTADL